MFDIQCTYESLACHPKQQPLGTPGKCQFASEGVLNGRFNIPSLPKAASTGGRLVPASLPTVALYGHHGHLKGQRGCLNTHRGCLYACRHCLKHCRCCLGRPATAVRPVNTGMAL